MPDMSTRDTGDPAGGDAPLAASVEAAGAGSPTGPRDIRDTTGLTTYVNPRQTITDEQASQPHASNHGNRDATSRRGTCQAAPGVNKPHPFMEPTNKTNSNMSTQPPPNSGASAEIKQSLPGYTGDSELRTEEVGASDSASNNKLKEASFIQTVRNEAKKLGKNLGGSSSAPLHHKARKKVRKGIFISYSPDTGYLERKFVVETVRQLKENNLAEDIWFDKDEHVIDSPCWFSVRMEAVERCRAAVLFLSDSYFSCPVSVYEGKALLERQKSEPGSVQVFLVLYSLSADTDLPPAYQPLLPGVVDLTSTEHGRKSLAEKSSVVVGALMMELERHASILAPPAPPTAPDPDFTGAFRKQKLCTWSAADLQEWLFQLGVKEFYRQSLAEQQVDGFLLLALTDSDMMAHLAIDSRVVRKKIMQQILVTLDKEHKSTDNWHLRARTQRAKPNCVYLVYDPTDVRLAQNLKQDLTKKGVTVREFFVFSLTFSFVTHQEFNEETFHL